jgi:hypothetical protein
MRERQVWIAVTAVLATALAWLAALSLVLVVNAYAGRVPDFVVALPALGHALLSLTRASGPVALTAVAAAGLTLAAALPHRARAIRRIRHG